MGEEALAWPPFLRSGQQPRAQPRVLGGEGLGCDRGVKSDLGHEELALPLGLFTVDPTLREGDGGPGARQLVCQCWWRGHMTTGNVQTGAQMPPRVL